MALEMERPARPAVMISFSITANKEAKNTTVAPSNSKKNANHLGMKT